MFTTLKLYLGSSGISKYGVNIGTSNAILSPGHNNLLASRESNI